MSLNREKCLETLGLTKDADASAIKRAYFRLVREHSPEKDPEQFRVIREAYEVLQQTPEETRPEEYPPPTDESARMFWTLANNCLKKGDLEGALRLVEDALKFEPTHPGLLLQAGTLQLRTGHSQLAAKWLEKMTVAAPDSVLGWKFLAQSLLSRGWYKKALPAFRKAYALGVRELDFLDDYAGAARDNGFPEEMEKLCREILARDRWDKETLPLAQNAYFRLARDATLSLPSLRAFLTDYPEFLRKNRRLLTDADEGLSIFLALFLAHQQLVFTPEAYPLLDAALASLVKSRPDWVEQLTDLRNQALWSAMEKGGQDLDKEAWITLIYTCLTDEYATFRSSKDRRMTYVDAMMCLLEDPDRFARESACVAERYPYILELFPEVSEAMDPETAPEVQKRLRWEYRKYASSYSGFMYQHRYEKKAADSKAISDEEPYVRGQEKVGRNDPCPCGSGKKFKRCCMGKGIYD